MIGLFFSTRCKFAGHKARGRRPRALWPANSHRVEKNKPIIPCHGFLLFSHDCMYKKIFVNLTNAEKSEWSFVVSCVAARIAGIVSIANKHRHVYFNEIDIDHWCVTTCRVFFCLLYTSPSPRDRQKSRMPSSA